MAEQLAVQVPDIGDFDAVDVVEILVAVGSHVDADDSLITIESDKASMEVPSPSAGTVRNIAVAIGDQVGEGDLIVTLELDEEPASARSARDSGSSDAPPPPSPVAAPAASSTSGPRPSEEPEPTRAEPTKAEPKGAETPAEHAEPSEHSEPEPFPSHDHDFDLVVIGAGPGGYTAAFRAADLGLKTALIERYDQLGGVCLNVGCIPSKALLHAAAVIEEAEAFATRGITFGRPKIDLDALRGFKDSVVGRLTGGLTQLAKRRKVTTIQGTATFSGPRRLHVNGPEGERNVSFERAIIAVGSRTIHLSDLPDDPRMLDSTSALALDRIPRSLLVVGGGIIGLEMATVYRALGSKVTIVELMDRLMVGCDRDLARPLVRRLESQCEAIHLETRVTSAKALKKGIRVEMERVGDDIDAADASLSEVFDAVLVGIGRRPNGDRIGAEAAGVAVDDRGFIAVDAQMRTNVEHIFAIGDVVGQPMLAHKATHEGKVAAEVAAGLKSGFEASVIPSVAYTDPEVAWVGLTEEEARGQGIEYGKGSFPWAASGKSLGLGRDEGLTKLLFSESDGRLLGAGIVGPHAGDLIAEACLAIEMGADAQDLGLTIHPHPTLSESIGLAAEAYEGTITDLYLPKRKKR